jgi:hypothetical protein
MDVKQQGRTMEELRRSGVGIASFVLGVISLAAFVVAASTFFWYDRNADPDLDALFVFVIAMVASLSTAIVGLVLGIIGLRQEGRRRFWPIGGTAVSVVVLVAWAVLRQVLP